jgi:hypothetical protein
LGNLGTLKAVAGTLRKKAKQNMKARISVPTEKTKLIVTTEMGIFVRENNRLKKKEKKKRFYGKTAFSFVPSLMNEKQDAIHFPCIYTAVVGTDSVDTFLSKWLSVLFREF